jgi:hypothetical protein
MCDKCAKLDKKIEHYETILVSIGDRVTVERLMALVADLRAQKAALFMVNSKFCDWRWRQLSTSV